MSSLAVFTKFQDLPLLQAIRDGKGCLTSVDIIGLNLAFDKISHLKQSKLRGLIVGPFGPDAPAWHYTLAEQVSFAEGGTYELNATSCTFSACSIVNVSFCKSTFTSSVFQNTDFRSADFDVCLFTDATLVNCDFGWATIRNTSFLSQTPRPFSANISSTKFSSCVFIGYDFSQVESFDLGQFENCQFINCSLSNAQSEHVIKQGNLVAKPQTEKTDPPTIEKNENSSKEANPVQVKPEQPAKVTLKPEKPSRFSSIEAMD